MEHAPELVAASWPTPGPARPWRRDLDLPEPSHRWRPPCPRSSRRVAAAGGADDAVSPCWRARRPRGGAGALASAVLRTALESRRDQRAVRSPWRCPSEHAEGDR